MAANRGFSIGEAFLLASAMNSIAARTAPQHILDSLGDDDELRAVTREDGSLALEFHKDGKKTYTALIAWDGGTAVWQEVK